MPPSERAILRSAWSRSIRENTQSDAVFAMEIGVHNGTLAIAIASSPLLLNDPLMAIPAAIYSLIMFVTAAAFSYFMSRRLAAAPAD